MNRVFILLAAGLLFLCSAHAIAQTTEEPSPPQTEVIEADALALETPDEETPGTTNPPPYIGELLGKTELTQLRLTQMRSAGLGWGNIKIAANLAEQMVGNSTGEPPLTFDAALDSIMAARAEGKGFGQIAKDNNLKIGKTVHKRNQKGPSDVESKEGLSGREFSQTRGKKRGLFARLTGFLGFGKKEKLNKPVRPDESDGVEKPNRLNKPKKNNKSERPVRPERGSKPEKPEKVERPSKPERPERPSKPEKPEKPQRGPKR